MEVRQMQRNAAGGGWFLVHFRRETHENSVIWNVLVSFCTMRYISDQQRASLTNNHEENISS